MSLCFGINIYSIMDLRLFTVLDQYNLTNDDVKIILVLITLAATNGIH